MIKQEIKDYIENMKKSGYSDEKIKEALKKAGWPESEYNEYFTPQPPPAVPSPETAPPTPLQKPEGPGIDKKQGTSRLAIVALVLSFIMPLIGSILGIVALIRISRKGQKGKGLAISAIILGIVMSFVYAFVLLIIGNILIQGLQQPLQPMYTENMQQQIIACGTEVDVVVLRVGDGQRACYSSENGNGVLIVQLENRGQRNIEDFKLTAMSNTLFVADGEIGILLTGSVATFKIPFKHEGEIGSLELSPKIAGRAGTPLIACQSPPLEWDSEEISQIKDCSETDWDDKY